MDCLLCHAEKRRKKLKKKYSKLKDQIVEGEVWFTFTSLTHSSELRGTLEFQGEADVCAELRGMGDDLPGQLLWATFDEDIQRIEPLDKIYAARFSRLERKIPFFTRLLRVKRPCQFISASLLSRGGLGKKAQSLTG